MMIEDDGGFMRHETARESLWFPDFCGFCHKVIDEETGHKCTSSDGTYFCCEGCKEEYIMMQCECREASRFEDDAYGFPD